MPSHRHGFGRVHRQVIGARYRRHVWKLNESIGDQVRATSLWELCKLVEVAPMRAQLVVLYAVVIVLFSLAYFSWPPYPSCSFRLDIPEVWRLFRGLFNSYFSGGRRHRPRGNGSLCRKRPHGGHGCHAAARRYGNGCADVGCCSGSTRSKPPGNQGDAAAMRRLRLIHWGGMLANLVIIAAVAEQRAVHSLTRICGVWFRAEHFVVRRFIRQCRRAV